MIFEHVCTLMTVLWEMITGATLKFRSRFSVEIDSWKNDFCRDTGTAADYQYEASLVPVPTTAVTSVPMS